jgi:LuxR family maltose regulon positive regulatory protein
MALSECPVIAVTAPAGYGKTTLLAQWAGRNQPRAAWLSADHRDNDPAVLLSYFAAALDRVERIEPKVFRSLASPRAGLADVARLASSIASMSAPVVVVLDQAEAITNPECRDMVAELALRLPAGSQLANGSRQEAPVPVSRLRAQGGMAEIGIDELAMEEEEARSLVVGAGIDLEDTALTALVEQTEGWPAGLYLAALAINAGGAHVGGSFAFTGDDRFMGDYLRSEFLDRVSRADVSFLTRASILDRMSGPLCDVALGRKGSARVLDRLERHNLLVIPLDRRGEWYRFHNLFRELLQAELMRREPDIVPALHVRAASWYEANRMPEAALEHAMQAPDADRVASLVLKLASPVWASGRSDTVLRWMEWFSANGLLEAHPAVAVHGALMYALIGRAGEAERWATAVERTQVVGVQSDGSMMEALLAYLGALLCREGLDEMCRDAQAALEGLEPSSPYRPAMLHAQGVAHLLRGDLSQADQLFARAVDQATSSGGGPFVAVLLAERGIVAIQCGEWPEAESLADDAISITQDHLFDDYWTSALVYAWAARVASRRGDVATARDFVGRAARLRPLLTSALPIVSIQALVELARAYIALADPAGARAALRQVDDIHRLRPRMLPLLPSHLSLEEISQRLLVSRNTVKTQTISIYRKLGVSTRGETITRMYQLGLVSRS